MKIRRALIALLCTAGLVACDDESGNDAGTDGGVVVLQDGGSDDGGGGDTDGGDTDGGGGDTDGGGNTDGGGGNTDGGDSDAGVMGDAGCTVTACLPTECGMRDDGCGTMIDCGTCAVGAACAADADCASMNCLTEADTAWPAGYCTAECRYDTDCAAGTHCAYRADLPNLPTLLGVCVADCMNDTDCRTNYTCRDADEAGTTECAPSATGAGVIGDACNSFADCAGGVDGFCIPQGTAFFGGNCSTQCMVDADCGAGNHCGFIPAGGGEGVCAPNCTMDSDCRGMGTMGYSCHNADDDAGGVLECWAGGTGAGAPGAACVGLWECAGGGDAACQTEAGDALGGYCLTTDCTIGGTDCATGSHCVQFQNTNACLADCTMDTDCRGLGYACYDVDNNLPAASECWLAGTGTAGVGAACTGIFDCAGRERAICARRPGNDFVDGYCLLGGCTNPPAAGSDCPVGSHCTIFTTMGVPNATGICTDDCATDADCRGAGYSCFDTGDVDVAPECWPGGTGTGNTGDACRWTEDCAGGPNATCLIAQITVAPPFRGGYCTDACTVDTDCSGVGAVCQSGLCWQSCTAPLDCRMMDQYTCTIPMFAGFTQNICWSM